MEGFTPPPGQELQVDIRVATVNYFPAMEIPLRQGRFFEDRDKPDGPPVVLIDEKMAKRFWPNVSAIGKHVWFDAKKPMEIVGVVGSVKQYGLDIDGKLVVYLAHQQNPLRSHVHGGADVVGPFGYGCRNGARGTTR